MKIFLTGFMGCGKTSVGRRLASRLGVPFVDLDERVESASGRRIDEIFATEGEAEFRRLEATAFDAALDATGSAVIAVGGGTFSFPGHLERAKRAGLVVWLNPPFAEIARRIAVHGKPDRPLFRDSHDAFDLYRQRLPSYRRADLALDIVPGETEEETAARLALRLAEARCST